VNSPSTFSFQWLSPLGISVALFLLYGAVYLLIGALTPIMMNTEIGQQVTVSSTEKDDALLGGPLPALLRASPALAKLRTMLLSMIGGLLVTAGILVLTVTWFGLRQGQGWALAALALAGVAVFPFWWLVFRPFGEAGIRVGLDWPPFMLIPTVLLGPAMVLGWIGLR
jgi:hypothetical protein